MKKRRTRTQFVPKAVYRTAFVGVVPVCVAGIACSSGSGGSDGGPVLTVACSFCGVAVIGFTSDAGDSQAADAPSAADSSGDQG